jgi:hypothetical protein
VPWNPTRIANIYDLRGIAGAGAGNRAPVDILRGEEALLGPYGHYIGPDGKSYTAYVPGSAPTMDCTQWTGFANKLPTTGSGEYPSSRDYGRVTTPMPGDTEVWRATSPTGERVGHAAILSGEGGNRALLHEYGPRGGVVLYRRRCCAG